MTLAGSRGVWEEKERGGCQRDVMLLSVLLFHVSVVKQKEKGTKYLNKKRGERNYELDVASP